MDRSLICVVIVLFACLQQSHAGCSMGSSCKKLEKLIGRLEDGKGCSCKKLEKLIGRLEDAIENIGANSESESEDNVVLRAISGSGRHVLNDWKNDAYDCHDANSDECKKVYKNKDLMDRWNDFSKARVRMYKGDKVVAWLLFNIEGTTPNNFWDKNKLESSSWTDLPKANKHYQAFTMDYGGRVPYRDFYITNNFHGCPNDRIWIMVRNPSRSRPICKFDGVTKKTPYFLYSTKKTMGQFDTDKKSMGIADRFEISLEE